MDASTDVKALAIHPQGRVASNAPAESREGGGTYTRLREPGPAFMGRGLNGLILGVQKIQEAVAAVRGVLEQLAPVLRSLNVGTLTQKIARRPRAPAHSNLERHDDIVGSLLHAPLHMGGHKPEVNRALRVPSKPGAHSATTVQGENLP
jgi:hypothetical protein